MAEVRTTDLALDYGAAPVIEHLTLRLPQRAVSALLGRNGCGKSTLLRGLARVLAPTHGAALLDGKSIHDLPTRALARRLGLLPQAPTSPAGLTVEGLVTLGRYPHRGLLGLPEAGDDAAVERALAESGMADLRHRLVDELSGGQKQRAWIALTLAQESEVILLDEPTTFLDPAHQLEILQLIRKLQTERGATVVMVLHDLNHAARFSDHLVVLDGGRLVAEGPPGEVLNADVLRRAFGVEADIHIDPRTGRPLCVPYAIAGERFVTARLSPTAAGAAALLGLLCLAPFVGSPLRAAGAWHALLAGPGAGIERLVLWDVRLPRILLGVLVGASAAVAGSVTQALTRNVLGTPSILGLNVGAALALLLAQVAGVWLTGPERVAVAFVGAAITGGLVIAVSVSVRGGDPGVRMALAGACIGMAVSALLILCARVYDLRQDLVLLQAGGLGRTTWQDVVLVGGPTLLGLGACAALAPRLTVGLLAPESAHALGVERHRLILWAGLTVLVMEGAVVAVAGPIGFVDLLIPLVVRARTGPDLRRMLLPCALGGAALVVGADSLARAAAAFVEVPTGLFTAVLGLPAFFWLVTRSPS